MSNKGLQYVIVIFIDAILCSTINLVQLKKENLKYKEIFTLIILNIIGIIIGSKILDYVVLYRYYVNNDILSSLTKGWMFYGGVVLSVCLTGLFCCIKQYKFERIIGIIFSNLILFYGIGKIGCFVNNCCYGLEYFGPFNISNQFPIQIFESLYCFTFYSYLQIKKKIQDFNNEKLLYSSMIILGIEKLFFMPFRGNSEVVSNCLNAIIATTFITIGIIEIKKNDKK